MPDQTDNTTAAHDNNTSRAATLNNTHRSHLRNTHHLHSCYATQRNFHTRLAYVLLHARFDKIVKSGTYQQIGTYPYQDGSCKNPGHPDFCASFDSRRMLLPSAVERAPTRFPHVAFMSCMRAS